MPSYSTVMNVARIHDREKLKGFWEQRIVEHRELTGREESRVNNSALPRLREGWLGMLNQRNQQQQSFFEEQVRRVQKTQQLLSHLN